MLLTLFFHSFFTLFTWKKSIYLCQPSFIPFNHWHKNCPLSLLDYKYYIYFLSQSVEISPSINFPLKLFFFPKVLLWLWICYHFMHSLGNHFTSAVPLIHIHFFYMSQKKFYWKSNLCFLSQLSHYFFT